MMRGVSRTFLPKVPAGNPSSVLLVVIIHHSTSTFIADM